MDNIRVKKTNYQNTWCINETEDVVFTDHTWDILHIVQAKSKEILASYTRNEVIALYIQARKNKRITRNKQHIRVIDIKGA